MEKHPIRRSWLGEGPRRQSRLVIKLEVEERGVGATELGN